MLYEFKVEEFDSGDFKFVYFFKLVKLLRFFLFVGYVVNFIIFFFSLVREGKGCLELFVLNIFILLLVVIFEVIMFFVGFKLFSVIVDC